MTPTPSKDPDDPDLLDPGGGLPKQNPKGGDENQAGDVMDTSASAEYPPLPKRSPRGQGNMVSTPPGATTTTSSTSMTTPTSQRPSPGPPASTWTGMMNQNNIERDYTITMWYKKNPNSTNTSLSQNQKGLLIFKGLKVPEGKLVALDDSRRDRLVLVVDGTVKMHNLNLAESLKAKEGLWTRPIAPVVEVKKISIYYIGLEVSNDEIKKAMANFGTVVGDVKYHYYESKDEDGEGAKLMKGVKKYDRYDTMGFVKVQHFPWGDFEPIMDTITMLEKKKQPFYLPRSKMTVF